MTDLIKQAYNPQAFREQGHRLIDRLADYLTDMQNDPHIAVLPWQSPEDRLYSWQADYEKSPDTHVNTFWNAVLAQSIHIHHPKYLGHQVCPPIPVSALSALLSAFLNNGMAVYEMGPVSSAIERIVTQEVARAAGYSKEAGGFMTSGGTLSNLTALLAARQAKAGDNVWQKGAQQSLALMVSEEAHYCIDRAVKVMGWGEGGIIKIPADDRFKMRTDLLENYYQQAKAEGRQVIAVVGSACSTSTGSYDPLEEIAGFCEKHSLWFHIDGAHGAPVVFSPEYKSVASGIERADSITIDFHKMMLTPAITTALLFKNEKHSYQTFAQKAAYLLNEQDGDWFNSGKRAFECTKRMMSIQVYAIMRTYGMQIFGENINTLYGLARTFARLVRQRNQMQLALEPEANIVCFRYMPEGLEEQVLNKLNAKIRQDIIENGEFYIVQTQLNGQLYLRTTIMNPFTTEAVLKQLLDEVEKVGKQALSLLQ